MEAVMAGWLATRDEQANNEGIPEGDKQVTRKEKR